jgi:outer membrane protein TolC
LQPLLLFWKGDVMNNLLRAARLSPLLALVVSGLLASLAAEPLPLRQAVQLALRHSTTATAAEADSQHAYASYREAHNQYLPQLVVGSSLGDTWGFPLSLEGSAPSIVNVTSQSALINPALREFTRAARTEWQASSYQGMEQRQQIIQDTVLTYAEINKWTAQLSHLTEELDASQKMEQIVGQRIQEGVDNPLLRNQARLTTARARLAISQARGAIDVLTNRLSQMTGMPVASLEIVPESIPALPEMKQDENYVAKAQQSSFSIQSAETHATAMDFRARGEHRSLWPSVDFAAQYALLAKFNNWLQFYQKNSFQLNDASIGVVVRFPFLSPAQRSHAQAADAEAFKAHNDVKVAKNQVSDETLRLQRSVEQLAAAQQVADLEYQIAQSNLEATHVRVDAGSATLHDSEDARVQSAARFEALQNSNFELERARIALLRSTGELEDWVNGK